MIAYHPYVDPNPNVWPYQCAECGRSNLHPIHRVLPPATTSTVDVEPSTMDMSPVARVARGITYIKDAYPNALSLIDVDDLLIEDGGRCVLGQIWGLYTKSFEFQVYPDSWLKAHGFVPIDGDDIESQAHYSALTAEWRNSLHEWMDEQP